MLFKNLKPLICFFLLPLFIFSSCFDTGSDDTSNTIPSPPSSVVITTDDKILTINWSAVSDATSYEIWINDTNNKLTAYQVGGVISETGYTLTGLTNGQTYYVWLKAENSAGTSDFGTMSEKKPQLLAPSAPGSAYISIGYKQLTLLWSQVTDAESYEIWYSLEDDEEKAVRENVVITNTTYILKDLDNNQRYYIWLKAKNAAGTSDFGPVAYGTPAYTSGYTLTYNLPDNVVLKFKYVPGGTFPTSYGTQTKPTDEGAEPETVGCPYWMAETEVTYELWHAVYLWATHSERGDSIYTFANPGHQGGSYVDSYPVGTNQHPVTTVSWRDSIVWCNALTEYYNANNGTEPDLDCVYFSDPDFKTPIRTSTSSTTVDGDDLGSQDAPYVDDSSKGFRLPTTLEWQCAARYKDGTNWIMGTCASGASSPCLYNSYAVVETYSGTTKPVKSKLENSLGIYDMSGNILEWCFRPSTISSPLYPAYGGDWYRSYNDEDYCSVSASLSMSFPYDVDNSSLYPGFTKGFRIARSE